jgi:hypothetical protein
VRRQQIPLRYGAEAVCPAWYAESPTGRPTDADNSTAEGQHWIVPQRTEPLPANATITYSVGASTLLAAGYTAYATNYARRVGATPRISAPALFVRSSAKAGIWCALLGATVNWYYHYAFTGPVVALTKIEQKQGWKIWEKTDKYTVDDGFLAGAGAGLALGVAGAVLMRRSPVSWSSKILGMVNIGACAGIAASNGYFQYTGERQKAVAALEEWRKRRHLEFHWIYWNRVFMSRLSPLAQGYVIVNGIFRTSLLPEEALQSPEKYGIPGIVDTPESGTAANTDDTSNHDQPDDDGYLSYYKPPYDYLENLREINVQGTLKVLEDIEKEKQQWLREAEYILSQMARKEYEFCHMDLSDTQEKQRREREFQLLEVTYNRFRLKADELDRRILLWNKSLQHKALLGSDDDVQSEWIPALALCKPDTHDPSLSIEEFKVLQDQFVAEIKQFEQQISASTSSAQEKRHAKKNLEQARMLLRAADRLNFDFEKAMKKVDSEGKVGQTDLKEIAGKASESAKKEQIDETAKPEKVGGEKKVQETSIPKKPPPPEPGNLEPSPP